MLFIIDVCDGFFVRFMVMFIYRDVFGRYLFWGVYMEIEIRFIVNDVDFDFFNRDWI